MHLVEWNDELSVNIAEIDAQHQKLVVMINDLDRAMREGRGKEIIGRIVSGLASYTATHFATEEKYFELCGYPAGDEHIREHGTFMARVEDFRKGIDEGRLGLSVSVMTFLGSWLRDHILGSDMGYVPFLNRKGIR